MLWFLIDDFITDQPSKIFDFQQRDFFKIISKKDTSYELKLPKAQCINHVFHVNMLHEKADNYLPGQYFATQSLAYIVGNDEYESDLMGSSTPKSGHFFYKAD